MEGWSFASLIAKVFLALLPDLEALARSKVVPNPPKVAPPPIDEQEAEALATAKRREAGGA